MATPDRPTIQNTGSKPIYLEIQFGPMVGQKTRGKIDSFGAVWRGVRQDSIPAGVPFCFRAAPPLEPNGVAQLDLLVTPPGRLPSDVYKGTLKVVAREACSD